MTSLDPGAPIPRPLRPGVQRRDRRCGAKCYYPTSPATPWRHHALPFFPSSAMTSPVWALRHDGTDRQLDETSPPCCPEQFEPMPCSPRPASIRAGNLMVVERVESLVSSDGTDPPLPPSPRRSALGTNSRPERDAPASPSPFFTGSRLIDEVHRLLVRGVFQYRAPVQASGSETEKPLGERGFPEAESCGPRPIVGLRMHGT